MKIKPIYPKMHDTSQRARAKYRLVPPQSLLTLATLTPLPHTVEICDETLTRLDLDDRPDLAGITVCMASAAEKRG